MRRKAQPVREWMTRIPVEVERCESVADAVDAMQAHNIRHIPVMNGSHLQGIVSQRDLLEARIDHGDALDAMPLEKVCHRDVLTVRPLDPVDQVAQKMLDKQVGSALVVDGGFVVGIFTTVDALKILSHEH